MSTFNLKYETCKEPEKCDSYRGTQTGNKLFLRGPKSWTFHKKTSSSYFKYVQNIEETIIKELKYGIIIVTHQIKNIIK